MLPPCLRLLSVVTGHRKFSQAHSVRVVHGNKTLTSLFTAWQGPTASSSSLDSLSHPSLCNPAKVRYIPKATETTVALSLRGMSAIRGEKMERRGLEL